MPYINQEIRKDYDTELQNLVTEYIRQGKHIGDINYMISYIIRRAYPKLSYQDINAIVGALECAKLEYYRMIAVDYEESKLEENGDV